MSLIFKSGDIFADQSEAIINTVNCVGVMGKGVALEFKRRWPENYAIYKKACESKSLRPGTLLIFDRQTLLDTHLPRYLVNFPTKDHWRAKSKISYIEDGLDRLRIEIRDRKIKSVAMPPLGCGNGGLDWQVVKPIILEKLQDLEGVDITVYEPTSESNRDHPEHIVTGLEMTLPRAQLLSTLSNLEPIFGGSFDQFSIQKIVYFMKKIGFNLNIDFLNTQHGPHSEALNRAFIAFEKFGMISGYTDDPENTHVTNRGYAISEEYLQLHNQDISKLINNLSRLVQGFETPYGLELLSKVHATFSKDLNNPEKIYNHIKNDRNIKGSEFDDRNVMLAFERLKSDHMLT